jgi:putative tryptophan/tyrosine transport system substrate-binding protein
MLLVSRADALRDVQNGQENFGITDPGALGGLMAYASDLLDAYRRAAGYVDQILKGTKAGEIPIYLAVKFELVVNMKGAKAIGLTIPPALLLRANEVIE